MAMARGCALEDVHYVQKAMTTVNAETAEAWRDEDKAMIFAAIQDHDFDGVKDHDFDGIKSCDSGS